MAQVRQCGGLKLTRYAAGKLGRELLDHLDVVGGLECGLENQRAASDLLQGIFELVESVGGVDVDEYQARLGRGELRHYPLGAVRRPDPDPISRLEPQCDQPGGEPVDVGLQLAVAPAYALMRNDECVRVGVKFGNSIEG